MGVPPRPGEIATFTVPSGTRPNHSADPSTGPFMACTKVAPLRVLKRISGRTGSSKKLAE